MPDNLKEILSHLSPEIDQETLLLYLQGKLSADKKHEVEARLLDNEFASDALEGLQAVNSQQRVNEMVEALNRDLKKKTSRRKKLRDRMRLPDQTWLIIAIIIILLLIVISYFVVRRTMNGQ